VKPIRALPLCLALLLLGIWALPGCTTAEPKPDPEAILDDEDVVPEEFRASIGGYLGGSRTVELREGSLYYWTEFAGAKSEPEKITPTEAQWGEFRSALNGAKVRQWRTDYGNPAGILDGTQWSLELKYARNSITTKGDNNYPGASINADSRLEPGALFRLYLDAMRQLLGGRDFR
jgi:hypothetical protein